MRTEGVSVQRQSAVFALQLVQVEGVGACCGFRDLNGFLFGAYCLF